MKHFYTIALAALCAAAPATLQAQATPERAPTEQRGPRGGRIMAGPGLDLLLGHRAELGLTDPQVSNLRQIQIRLQEKNRPLTEQLRAAGFPVDGQRQGRQPMTQEQRQALRGRMEQLRPVMKQLGENRRAAMQEAQAVLTREQRAKVRELASAQREQRQRERGPQRAGAPRGAQFRGR